MKDPIRYYLSEGFMCLFAFTSDTAFVDSDQDIKLFGNFHAVPEISKKLKVRQVGNKKWLTVDGVAYPIDNEFFKTYATLCDNEIDALERSTEWANEVIENNNYFESVRSQLSLKN